MRALTLGANSAAPLQILAIGAHSDDIEIGCGGSLLRLIEEHPGCAVRWVVLSGGEERAREARASATDLLAGVANPEIISSVFKDGFFPYQGAEVKAFFEGLKTGFNPDIIFTHRRDDAHQDHRVVAELTWNTFRDHLILEYEIPKYEGDLGAPNIFITLTDATKATYLMSQVYTPGTDRGARHDDPAFAITWPIAVEVISDKDQYWPTFESA